MLYELRRSQAGGSSRAFPQVNFCNWPKTVARARWAGANARLGETLRLYLEAVAIEQRIPYGEPPYWYYSVHKSLGATLYRAGRYREATSAFQIALSQSPNNGWALYGLATSAPALGHRREAEAANSALNRVWSGNRLWLRMNRP